MEYSIFQIVKKKKSFLQIKNINLLPISKADTLYDILERLFKSEDG